MQFISTTTSDHQYSNSILECPPMRPMMMDTTNSRKWSFTNKIEIAPNCPRCASSNTKFCYYNNYSLSQPRYFCKGCRRYWTKGGSLRNVPVGGGCRKSRRSRSSSSAVASRHGGGPGGGSAMGSGSESEGSTCIDMAAVFANYVNQNNVGSDESFSPGGSSGSSSDNNVQAAVMSSLDLVNRGDDQVQQMDKQFSVHQQMDGQDFVYQDCDDAFDQLQQSILGDENHMLWPSDDGTNNIPSFRSENPTVEVQDFGLFSPDDQFRISANLVTDNWGSFDLSTYEIFSTP